VYIFSFQPLYLALKLISLLMKCVPLCISGSQRRSNILHEIQLQKVFTWLLSCLFYFIFWDTVLLCSLDWSWTRDPPASASWVLGLRYVPLCLVFVMTSVQCKKYLLNWCGDHSWCSVPSSLRLVELKDKSQQVSGHLREWHIPDKPFSEWCP
jgi:hypothetical protein